jgi:uncharacterized lipoprotein
MNKKILTIALLSVIIFSGCALTTDRITLQYNQQQGISQIPGASNISVSVKVNDSRPDKSKVSSKKNGYGMEMAPIVAEEDVSITIRNAIEQEIRIRGFRLGSDDALVNVIADLTRFYSDFKIGFFSGDAVADLNMSVIVKSKNGDLLYSRNVVSNGIEQNTQLASGHNARLALNRALENSIKSLFSDQEFLSALLDKSGIPK